MLSSIDPHLTHKYKIALFALRRFVAAVWAARGDTPVVRASGRELSFVLLAGIMMCYLVTFALVQRPTDLLCSVQRSVGPISHARHNSSFNQSYCFIQSNPLALDSLSFLTGYNDIKLHKTPRAY